MGETDDPFLIGVILANKFNKFLLIKISHNSNNDGSYAKALSYICSGNLGAKYSVGLSRMVGDYDHFILAMSYHIYRDVRKAGFPLFAADSSSDY